MRVIALCLLLASVLNIAHFARILGVFHMPAYSHFVLGETLFKELAKRGHEVTMISSFPQKTPVKNYRDVPLKKLITLMEERKNQRNIFDWLNLPVFFVPLFMSYTGLGITETVFQEESVQDLLKSNEEFDVVIVEQFFNEAHKGFAHRFNASLIVFSTIGSSIWIDHLVGNPLPISYKPDLFLSYSSHMTFFQRVVNAVHITLQNLYYNLYYFGQQNDVLHKYIPDAPHIFSVMYNTSLILLNSHITCNFPVPRMPNMIEIGGFHVKEAGKLPEDLQKFLDESKEGVIYFAFGSNLRIKDMPKEKIEQFVKAIGKLNMKVLWKVEEEGLIRELTNLKTGKWFPQQSILAHPNVKLFITHGGLLSMMESLYYGVPILGIPIYGDQKMNMAEAVEKGYGLSIEYNQFDEHSLYSTIKELIDNPKYLENAKIRSKILLDRETKPIDTAIYWVEYVIRHKGAHHFRSAALDLQWYQHLLLDVLLFLITTVVIAVGSFYCLLRYLLKRRKAAKTKQQ